VYSGKLQRLKWTSRKALATALAMRDEQLDVAGRIAPKSCIEQVERCIRALGQHYTEQVRSMQKGFFCQHLARMTIKRWAEKTKEDEDNESRSIDGGTARGV
jgi:hypothetical protein